MQSSLYLLQRLRNHLCRFLYFYSQLNFHVYRETEFYESGELAFKSHLNYLLEYDNSDSDGITEDSLENDIISMDEEMAKLNEELGVLNEKHTSIINQRSVLKQQAFENRQMRNTTTERLNRLQNDNNRLVDQIASVDDETIRTISALDRYKQINGMNDAFYIWYAGPYATINSFRMGNLTNKPIEFTEINAALGQAALVVSIIASKAGVTFRHFVVSPMGSFPKVLKADDRRTSYPLFIDQSSFTLFPKRNFNLALQGFMSCVQELGDYVSSYDPTLAVPYKISVGESKIGDLSFVYGGDDEVWTRSLKFMLSDVKWIIAWYTKHCNSSIHRTAANSH